MDDALGRVVSITDDGAAQTYAEYGCLGAATIVKVAYPEVRDGDGRVLALSCGTAGDAGGGAVHPPGVWRGVIEQNWPSPPRPRGGQGRRAAGVGPADAADGRVGVHVGGAPARRLRRGGCGASRLREHDSANVPEPAKWDCEVSLLDPVAYGRRLSVILPWRGRATEL